MSHVLHTCELCVILRSLSFRCVGSGVGSHDFFDDTGRRYRFTWNAKRAPHDIQARKLFLKHLFVFRVYPKEAAMTLEDGKVCEPPEVAVVGHAVADFFPRRRRDFPNCRAKLFEFGLD